jgi:phloretin hydrolase
MTTLTERTEVELFKDKSLPEWTAQKTYDQNFADTKHKGTLPELTPEEKKRPFAKYFYEAIKQPDPKHYNEMETPKDPKKAFGPEELNRLLDLKYLESDKTFEIGWCHLPNGTGYIANKIFYPGVTAEMIDWWFAWHPLEDLRYRIWYPPQHGGLMLSPIDRERILDPNIPVAEKNWGVTHHVTENCDCGMDNIDIMFRSPEAMGFDMPKFRKVAATFAGGMGWQCPVDKQDDSITAPAIMAHIFYNVPGGLLHRTRFWMGYRIGTDNKPECSLPPGIQVPVSAVQGLARHNVKEFTRFGDFLPRIYKELGHSMFC